MVCHLKGTTQGGSVQNRVLGEIFGPARVEVRGELAKLHNDVL
jgi:hypothetical protein